MLFNYYCIFLTSCTFIWQAQRLGKNLNKIIEWLFVPALNFYIGDHEQKLYAHRENMWVLLILAFLKLVIIDTILETSK